MIVVVGRLGARGLRAIAGAISARGGRCEVVGTAPLGADGDRLLQAYAGLGAGHAAVLRTPATDLEPADLELALRYLPDARVIVLVGMTQLAPVADAAAAWSGAALVIVTEGAAGPAELPAGERSLVLAAPARDPDAAFAGLVAELALRVEAGEALAAAWPATLAAIGAEAVSGGRAPDRAAAPVPAGRPAVRRAAGSGPGRRSGRS